MAKAKDTLAHGEAAITILARQLARTAVKEKLRSQGLRLTRLKASDIEAQSRQYLAEHPRLYWLALERAIKIGLIAPGDQDTPFRCWRRQFPEIIPYPAFPLIEKELAEHPERTLMEVLRR
jgi:hypothetical protein